MGHPIRLHRVVYPIGTGTEEIGTASDIWIPDHTKYFDFEEKRDFVNGVSITQSAGFQDSKIVIGQLKLAGPTPTIRSNPSADLGDREASAVIGALVHMLGDKVTLDAHDMFAAKEYTIEVEKFIDPWMLKIRTTP